MKNIHLFGFILFACGQISAQCLVLNNCPNVAPVCDYSPNNPSLWNETYWLDPASATQDLSDASVAESVTVSDTCPGTSVTIRYLLFLDLDKNGTWETVVKSWEPPAPGTVNFNNWNAPNYDGGEARVFDERPVAADAKYQFALETASNGDTTQAYLRWNTTAAPGIFVNPELPYATHKIKWLIEDDLGNDEVCEYPIVVKDCKAPTAVCLNGLSVNIMPTGEITMWASDFIQYTEDNATPSNLLQLGIRKLGSGVGFPEDGNGNPVQAVTYTCDEQGLQIVEVWAKDAAGNADFCETYVLVQDNTGTCGQGGGENPTVVCINGLGVNIMPTGMVTLWASDFLQYAEDDNTPANLLEFGIRKTGTGTGFPEDINGNPILSLNFTCFELGTQSVELWARDLDGNADYCETYVIVQDNLGACGQGGGGAFVPTVICLNGLAVNIMSTGMISLWATDFLQYAQDDNTPSNLLDFAIRKSGTGTGFPQDGNGDPLQIVTFDCDELGVQLIELWARDLDGNADYCETYVLVQDNAMVCNGLAEIATCAISACNGTPLQEVGVTINQNQISDMGPVGGNGCPIFPSTAPIGGNLVITPIKNNFPLNGVTVLDIIILRRWILGLEPNLSPFTLIAADANKSGTLTGFDVIEMRKLILGINQDFPSNNSWRFVDADFNFPNPQNPFQTVFPESITIPNAQQTSYQVGFKAIKVGDLDCDAWPGLQGESNDRGLPKRTLTLPDVTLLEGEIQDISLQMEGSGDWTGLQMGLQFDPEKVDIVEVMPGDFPGFDDEAFYQPKPGAFRFIWADEQAGPVAAGRHLLTLRIRALAPIKTSEIFKTSEDFENLGSLGNEPQTLALDFRQDNPATTLSATIIFAPQPNPTSEGTRIPLKLSQTEKVNIQISDLSGRVLWANEMELNAGSHLLDVAPQTLSQAGVYIWRVRAGNESASGKLVRI